MNRIARIAGIVLAAAGAAATAGAQVALPGGPLPQAPLPRSLPLAHTTRSGAPKASPRTISSISAEVTP